MHKLLIAIELWSLNEVVQQFNRVALLGYTLLESDRDQVSLRLRKLSMLDFEV